MSKTKAAGSTKLGRDSQPKYLGVKLFGGQKAKAGSIIIRQNGSTFLAGKNTKLGRNNSIYSLIEGVVKFTTKQKTGFNRKQRKVKIVNVDPIEVKKETKAPAKA